MTPPITVILTSCGRQDLLQQTINSFLLRNTYHITEWWIYEDSGVPGINDVLKSIYPFIKWIEPNNRHGQIVALDTLWSKVKTPYAFHCEDDWLFTRPGFIEKSISIMEAEPKIAHVWLRDAKDLVAHPIQWGMEYGILKASKSLWAGFQFSPSVKRLADYRAIGSYGKYTTFDKNRPWKAEAAISQLYNRLGYKAAILNEAHILHIGADRHVN